MVTGSGIKGLAEAVMAGISKLLTSTVEGCGSSQPPGRCGTWQTQLFVSKEVDRRKKEGNANPPWARMK